LTIGNYLGALKNWVKLQDDYNCIYCVVDMHAITLYQEPAQLRNRSLQTLAIYLACGMDVNKSIFFIQSHVPAHAQLSWVLGCNTMFGELSRMTQFKDKSSKHSDNINVGLFTYPILMASDILLYNADLVPVGADQKQHIEITRDIATRFNNKYSPTFTLPEPYIAKNGARVMSLADPSKKMSKSDPNVNAYISLLDPRDVIIKKFSRAVTDSDIEIKEAPSKPGISNLLNIYSCFTNKTVSEAEKEFEGKSYKEFKTAVGEVCADKLDIIQTQYNTLIADKAYLESVLKDGAEKANYLANKTLRKVYKKIGFYNSIT